jgi:thiamine monophosphate synthase
MIPFPGILYPILDMDTCLLLNQNETGIVSLWRRNGLAYFQLRAKGYSEEFYIRRAEVLKSEFPDMSIIANDFASAAVQRSDLFAGLHIGQEDLLLLDQNGIDRINRCVEGAGFIVGLSTHNLSQVRSVIDGRRFRDSVRWSYIAVGPVFATGSKPLGRDPVIMEEERRSILAAIGGSIRAGGALEVILIGGLNSKNYTQVIPLDFRKRNGFLPVPAMISSITDQASLSEWIALLTSYCT